MKACALLSSGANKADQPIPHIAHMRNGVILSVPVTLPPRELILALRELERLAIEDYLKRTADGGGT